MHQSNTVAAADKKVDFLFLCKSCHLKRHILLFMYPFMLPTLDADRWHFRLQTFIRRSGEATSAVTFNVREIMKRKNVLLRFFFFFFVSLYMDT